jgi:hypothetical protein
LRPQAWDCSPRAAAEILPRIQEGIGAMFGTPVINVAIGLVFCFAAVSLATSTVTETLDLLVEPRANTLPAGIQASCTAALT